MPRQLRAALCAVLIAGLSGCSLHRIALRQTADIVVKGIPAIYEEGDLRLAREAMPGQLKLLESLLINDPDNPELLATNAQGFGGYAFLFVEQEDPARARALYRRGRDYGLRRLDRVTGIDFLAESDMARFDRALKKLGKDEIAPLFWAAYCWGGMANLDLENPQTLADLPKIERMMLRVDEISPGYFYGGADLLLGAYYGSRPKMLGGDPKKSKECFERALKDTGRDFLMAQVLYAQHYAVAVQDRELFASLLKEVLDYPIEKFPEQRLTNLAAKGRAVRLLEKIDDYF